MRAFKESNAQLRTETEAAHSKLALTEAKLKEAEAQVMPLRQTIARLETREKVLTSDNTQFKEELERWKQRASELQDKF